MDSLRDLRVQRLCYCPHLLPLNNNGRVFCVQPKPFPIQEDCPTCPLRLDEDEIPSKLRGQVRRLTAPPEKQQRSSPPPNPDKKNKK